MPFKTGLTVNLSTVIDELPNVLNLVLGTNKEAKYTIGMTELLLPYFPVIFLRHSGKYLDTLVDGVLRFQGDEGREKYCIFPIF